MLFKWEIRKKHHCCHGTRHKMIIAFWIQSSRVFIFFLLSFKHIYSSVQRSWFTTYSFIFCFQGVRFSGFRFLILKCRTTSFFKKVWKQKLYSSHHDSDKQRIVLLSYIMLCEFSMIIHLPVFCIMLLSVLNRSV